MAAFVCEDPDTGADAALDEAVDGPGGEADVGIRKVLDLKS